MYYDTVASCTARKLYDITITTNKRRIFMPRVEKETEIEVVETVNETNGLAVASFVVGILAALTVWVGPVGLIFSVFATVFAAVDWVGNQTKNLAVAGFVLGVLSFIASLAFTIVMVVTINNDSPKATPMHGSHQMRQSFFDVQD